MTPVAKFSLPGFIVWNPFTGNADSSRVSPMGLAVPANEQDGKRKACMSGFAACKKGRERQGDRTILQGGRVSVLRRNNVVVRGASGRPAMVFAHGYGCDQNMWRLVTPAFADYYQIILFDHVGAGASDLNSYQEAKYGRLEGYADDIVEIGVELGLKDAVFVGHSVSAMMGILAAKAAPGMFSSLVMVGPSPVLHRRGRLFRRIHTSPDR